MTDQREKPVHLHCENGCEKAGFWVATGLCAACGTGRPVNVPDCWCLGETDRDVGLDTTSGPG